MPQPQQRDTTDTMPSSSPPRSGRRIAPLAALLVVLCGLQWLLALPAIGSQLDIVAVAASAADRQVRLVAEVRPATAMPIPSRNFSVIKGGVRLPTRTVPVISDRTVIGVIIDASAAGAANLEAGLSGAANFLLRMPLDARTAVIADTNPPKVLTPAGVGTTDALRAL